jgi:hypothetical protein
MSPEQFVDNGFVSRPNDRVRPTSAARLAGPFTFMPPSLLSTRDARKLAGVVTLTRVSEGGM